MNKGEAGHVVCCEVGERAVVLEECECFVKANYDSVLVVDGVDTNGIPFYIAVGVLNIYCSAGLIVGSDFKVSAVAVPKRFTVESVYSFAGCPSIRGVVNGLIVVCYPLRASITLNIAFCTP